MINIEPPNANARGGHGILNVEVKRKSSEMKWISLFLILLFSGMVHSQVQAQLQRVPIERKVTAPLSKGKSATARTKATLPLNLPFWDDFSFTPVNDPTYNLSNYPLDSLWEKSNSVWINEGIGINAPSFNVATFDGLDSAGLPYSDQVLANGFRDTLASRPIDLSVSAVSLSERSTVYLSFFFQLYGNGEPPDKNDYLRIEFKNNEDAWENVMTIFPKAYYERNVFYDTILQVNGERFFHEAFQFRFRNYGRQSGPFDTWNVDYIYLNKNRNQTYRFFPDAAFASGIRPLFGNYTSAPITHFFKTPILTAPSVDVFSLQDGLKSYDYRAIGNFGNYKDKELISENETVLVEKQGIKTTSGDINTFERVVTVLGGLPDSTNVLQFNPDADSIGIKLSFSFNPRDTLGTANYTGIDFSANDTVSTQYILKDYYAYDDGTAEYAVILPRPGDQAAYLFEMLVPQDTLIGFSIYIPRFGVTGNLRTDFYIFSEKDGTPDEVLYSISKTIEQKKQNEFQSIRIIPAVLVKDKFFIGWRAPVGGNLPVGTDVNNNTGDKMFVDTKGVWEMNTDIQGSLMIRPIFGKGEIITGIPRENISIHSYPNPNPGEFFISSRVDALEILSVTGQPVLFSKEDEGDRTRVMLANRIAGLYIVKIKKGNSIITHKLVVK